MLFDALEDVHVVRLMQLLGISEYDNAELICKSFCHFQREY